jgi:anti-sigma factor RsiW
MSDGPITFEILNAYVDGELDASATADVARAVAEDSELAHQVAAISRLRSVLSDNLDAPPQSMPRKADNETTPDRTLKRLVGARSTIAASIAFAMFVAGSVLVSSFDRNLKADMMQQAWVLHQGWTLDTGGPAVLVNTDYIKALPQAYIPDLTAARLSIVHASVKPISGNRNALLVGYRGTRGCKISLAVFPAPNSPTDPLDEEPNLSIYGNNEAYSWRTASLAYVIMSDGMDSERFRMLAKSVHLASRQHFPFNDRTRMALRKSRDKSAPCLA